MYTPKHFQIEDRSACHDVIRDNPFGVIVATDAGGTPEATHLPFHLEAGEGEHGTLYGHMARGNPLWRMFTEAEILCIFQGPHGFLSAHWYPEGPRVPTWNYVAVHCYGCPEVMVDQDDKARQLIQLSDPYDTGDWHFRKLPEDFVAGLMKGIVSFRLPISRMQGKAKLSQNRSPEDQLALIEGLQRTGRGGDAALAEAMQMTRKT